MKFSIIFAIIFSIFVAYTNAGCCCESQAACGINWCPSCENAITAAPTTTSPSGCE